MPSEATWIMMTSALLALAAANAPLIAQSTPAAEDARSRLGIGPIEVIPSLQKQLESEGKKLMAGRIVESLDSQLIDRLHNSRKFRMIARSDLSKILEEQDLTPLLDHDTTPESFKVSGIDYLVVVTVDHFEDRTEQQYFETQDLMAERRTIEIGAVAKLWNTESGELLESANWELGSNDDELDLPADLQRTMRRGGVSGDSDAMNRLLRRMGETLAQRISNRVVDVIYPAQVVGITGRQIAINRGDGTDINPGEIWTVYALGDEMIDPSTGVSLGRMEVPLNTVRIVAVRPNVAMGVLVEDQNFGIEVGHIARRED